MAQLFAGTSGWAYPSWKPDFYPQKLAQNEIPEPLCHAAERGRSELHLPATGEGNDAGRSGWPTAPEGFRFTIKAHQVITHIKRLKGTEDFLPRFLATIEPLASAGKAGSGAVSIAA